MLPQWLRLAAIVLLVFAIMRPQRGFLFDNSNRYGVDAMVAIDVSSSMTAEDFSPNRLAVAKQVLADFINGRPNDRIGLIVFGSQSYVQSPLTIDHRTLLSFLADVQIGLAEDGTAIGMALANAVRRLKDSQAKSKLIFLLTDGDNNAGAVDPDTAAKLAATYGIKIFPIGIGDSKGAPIPMVDQFGNKGYGRNLDGSLFLTKMNTEGLRKIAEVTGGEYYLASDANKLRAIFRELDAMAKSKFEGKAQFVFDERYGWFAWLALFLLLTEFALSRFWTRSLP
jgi:Ca-activated chloride channel family protein